MLVYHTNTHNLKARTVSVDEVVQVEAGAMIANSGVSLETKSGGKTILQSIERMFGASLPCLHLCMQRSSSSRRLDTRSLNEMR